MLKSEIGYNKILLFEDDLSLGNMIIEFLARNGYKAKLCSNPRDVNGFLRITDLFDIIFTDLHMMEITGTDILREIRKKESRIPVWLMTAHDDYTTERALSEGFSGLIRKPIQMRDLIDILSPGKRQRPLESSSGKKAPSLTEKFPRLASLFQEDEQTIKEILATFVESVSKEMATLTAYVAEGDYEKAQQLSHKIHPFFSQLNADDLCKTLRKMDRLRGEDESVYPGWKEDLTKTIAEVRQLAEEIGENYL